MGDTRIRLGFGFWFLVGPPEATAKPKGGRRKIAAPNHPLGGLLGPARVGPSGQPVTARPAPPGAVTGCKSFVLGGGGAPRWCGGRAFLGKGGGGWQHGAAQGAQRRDAHGRTVAPSRGAVRGRYIGAQRGTVLGHSGYAGAHHGSGQERRMQLCKGRTAGLRWGAAWSCARAQHVAAQGAQRVAALGRCMGPRRGAVWGSPGAGCGWCAVQPKAGLGRSVGLRTGGARCTRGAVWGRARLRHEAALGHSVGLRRCAVWACAGRSVELRMGARSMGGGMGSAQCVSGCRPGARSWQMIDDSALRTGVGWDWAWRCLGPRRDCAGAQCRTVLGRSAGLRRGTTRGCT